MNQPILCKHRVETKQLIATYRIKLSFCISNKSSIFKLSLSEIIFKTALNWTTHKLVKNELHKRGRNCIKLVCKRAGFEVQAASNTPQLLASGGDTSLSFKLRATRCPELCYQPKTTDSLRQATLKPGAQGCRPRRASGFVAATF